MAGDVSSVAMFFTIFEKIQSFTIFYQTVRSVKIVMYQNWRVKIQTTIVIIILLAFLSPTPTTSNLWVRIVLLSDADKLHQPSPPSPSISSSPSSPPRFKSSYQRTAIKFGAKAFISGVEIRKVRGATFSVEPWEEKGRKRKKLKAKKKQIEIIGSD